jgi:hypothetical protein
MPGTIKQHRVGLSDAQDDSDTAACGRNLRIDPTAGIIASEHQALRSIMGIRKIRPVRVDQADGQGGR